MVHVEVAPSHPVSVAQHAEHRMRLPRKFARLTCKALNQLQKIRPVLLKLRGLGSTYLCVDLRTRLQATGPCQWQVQRHPLNEPLRHRDRRYRDAFSLPGFFAHRDAERITQMTDHLMHAHSSPLARAGELNSAESLDHPLLVGWVR